MIGRRKALKAISFEKFKKRTKKNARKGKYKNNSSLRPAAQPLPSDTLLAREAITPPVTENKGMTALEPALLKSDSLVTLSDVLFEVNAYELKAEHFSALDLLSTFLLAHPTLEVSISGHTDSTGKEHHNVNLSLRRAETVAYYLIDKGVLFDKVYFEGLGSSQPISDNTSEQGRSKNRRVEILITNPKEK